MRRGNFSRVSWWLNVMILWKSLASMEEFFSLALNPLRSINLSTLSCILVKRQLLRFSVSFSSSSSWLSSSWIFVSLGSSSGVLFSFWNQTKYTWINRDIERLMVFNFCERSPKHDKHFKFDFGIDLRHQICLAFQKVYRGQVKHYRFDFRR